MNGFEELCDSLDAAVFTGDSLHSKENRDLLKDYMFRWDLEVLHHETLIALEDKS